MPPADNGPQGTPGQPAAVPTGFFARMLKRLRGAGAQAGSVDGTTAHSVSSASGGEQIRSSGARAPEVVAATGVPSLPTGRSSLLTADMLSAPEFLPEPQPAAADRQTRSSRTPSAATLARRELRAEQQRVRREAWRAEQQRLRANRREDQLARDIRYLGRGVSGRLNDRHSEVEKLREMGLPFLETPADVARALELTIPQLRGLAFHAEITRRCHYVQFGVPKKNGGMRLLSAPHRRLARVQQWIREQILDRLPVTAEAHGFVPERSILTNASCHCGQEFVLNLDLEDFFPSITFPRVRAVLTSAGYSPAVATIIALLCTECPRQKMEISGQVLWVATGPRGLPQGACTSPALSNQVCRRLDRRLAGLAGKHGIRYSRYADDLTFSGGAELQTRLGWLMARVRHIAEQEGFRIHEAKSRVQRRSMAQMVTGLVVNDRPGVPRQTVRRLRALLHHAAQEGLEAQNREGHPNFRAWVEGMIGFVGMARPELAEKFLEQLRSLPDHGPDAQANTG